MLLALLMMTMSISAMQVYVKLPTGGTITLEKESSDSFENLKASIEDRTGIAIGLQILTYNGQVLANDETLYQKGVGNGATVELSLVSGYYCFTAGTTECNVTLKVNDTSVTVAHKDDEVTIVINPTAGYEVSTVAATAYMGTGGMQAPRRTGVVKDITVSPTVSADVYEYTFTMPAAAVNVDVVCVASTQAVTAAAVQPVTTAGTFTFTPASPKTDDLVTVTPTSAAGWQVATVILDVEDPNLDVNATQSGSDYTYTQPAYGGAITVTFAKTAYTVTAGTVTGGSVSGITAATRATEGEPATPAATDFYIGDVVTFTAAPTTVTDHLKSLTVSFEGQTTTVTPTATANANEYQFTMLAGNATVNAEFTAYVSLDDTNLDPLPASTSQIYDATLATPAFRDIENTDHPTIGDILKAVTGGATDIEIAWYHSSDMNAPIGTGETYTIKDSDLGYSIVYVITQSKDADGNALSQPRTKTSPAVAVEKATPTVTVAPAAVTDALTYSSNPQTLFNTGTPSGGTMMYKVTTTDTKPTSTTGFKTTIDQGTAVGTYYLWYYIEGNASYNSTAINDVAITKAIDKAAPTYTAPAALALTYTGSAQNLVSAGTSSHGSFTYSTTQNGTYSATIPKGTNAGDYTVWYKFTGDANHSNVDATEVTGVSIGKKTATISYAMTALNKAFGDDAFTNTLSMDPSTGTGLGTVTYTVTAEIPDAECTTGDVANVDPSTGQVTITGFGTATITATVTDGTNYTYSGMAGYNEGTHSASVSYNLTVSKGTITVSVSGTGQTYNPSYSRSITVTVTKPASGATVLYSTDNSNWSSVNPSYQNAGTYTIYYKVEAANYTTQQSYATMYIYHRSGSITFSGTTVEKTYGDANFTKTYSSKTNDGAAVGYSSNNTSVATVNSSTGEVTIQGAGTAVITVTKAQSANYTSASATYTLTVHPADMSSAIVVLAQSTFQYDGNAKEPAVQAVFLSNKVLTANTDYTVGYANNVSAGNNTAQVIITGTGNYTGEATAAFTITPVTTTDGNITIVDGGDENREVTVLDMGNQQGNTLPDGLEVTALNYYRTLNENDEQAYTVCLPYNPLTNSNLKYYTLAECNGTTLSFQEISGAPVANTPYLVRASATTDIGQQDVHGVTMSKEVTNNSEAGGYVLKGTLTGISHDDALGLYILQSGNRWGRVGSDTHAYIPPFRAYIEATTSARPNSLDSTLGNDATGIEQLRTVDRDGTERYFDLQGHRIAKPAKGGVYIHNGKKVLNGK